ncbi:hypothetical protein PSACC_00044 [Paramicrosporidium saccamoebae]|uniref:Ankyrin repeat domain-containing protein n=1 Tax=Paramicrosporidium saccamoebae TaxID=1246581 RepID=A0A2H9TQX6_9FUNG|nr:hypothetical protein PSACC_00044 [Paramicrosporidium saccamoebae]
MSPANTPSPDLLHRLIWHNDAEKLDEALKTSSNVKILDEKEGHVAFIDGKYRGTTALGLAAQLGHGECIKVLLKHWADTLTSSAIGYYPLQEATSLGDRDIMRMLLLRRHEQLRQIWRVRQPSLADAIQSDLPNFFLEMDWHFRSWIPFLSRLCPSDTCRIWKKKNKFRVDSTLMGVEVDKLNWMHGNVSFIFHVNDNNSKMLALDHDRKLYEEIDKTKEFTEEEIEEDLNMRMNTQIYSGRMRKPKAVTGEKRVQFVRQQAGVFGLGGDKEEQVGPYNTRVYDVPDIEAIGKYRKEHIIARDKEQETESLSMSNHESLDSTKVLEEINDVEPQVEHLLQDAKKNLFVYVPSLPHPKNLPSVTEREYFAAKTASLPYMHAGRRIVQTEKSKKFRVSVWMADNFPLTVRQLMPFFEIMTVGNRNFEKLQEFISMDLPPGFPVRIEIPLFAFLAAQITFNNFQHWGDDIPRPQFANGDDWFEVPSDYKRGIVIKNIFKEE